MVFGLASVRERRCIYTCLQYEWYWKAKLGDEEEVEEEEKQKEAFNANC